MNTYIFIENKSRIWHSGMKTEQNLRGNIVVKAENEQEALNFIKDVYGHNDVRLIETVLPNHTYMVGEYAEMI